MNNRFIFTFLVAGITCMATAQDAVAPLPISLDFQSARVGDPPDDLTLTDAEAKFAIVAEGENRFLQMAGAPIVDGGVLLGISVKGAVQVKAKIRAKGKRRSSPRFGVGLHGVGGYRLWVVPAHKELQITKEDVVLAQVPLEWASGSWTHVEFRVLNAASGGSQIEGRAWAEGQPRPEAPQLTHSSAAAPGQGKASLWATPFSELPVDFDEVVVTAQP